MLLLYRHHNTGAVTQNTKLKTLAQKFDKNKFEISDDMPSKFAMRIPGMGTLTFQKEYLTNNDCKALVSAGCKWVTVKDKKPEMPEYKED